jgi:hypothetical protein
MYITNRVITYVLKQSTCVGTGGSYITTFLLTQSMEKMDIKNIAI